MEFSEVLRKNIPKPNPEAPTAAERFKSAWDYLVSKPGPIS